MYDQELYVLANYGDGSKWLVVKPNDLGFDEYVWFNEATRQRSDTVLSFGRVSEYMPRDWLRLLWIVSDNDPRGYNNQLSLYADRQAFAYFEKYRQLVDAYGFFQDDLQKVLEQ